MTIVARLAETDNELHKNGLQFSELCMLHRHGRRDVISVS